MKRTLMAGVAAAGLLLAQGVTAQMGGSMNSGSMPGGGMSGGGMAGAGAQGNPNVGGAAMMTSRNIAENAMNSPEHKTLVAAVQAAGLVDTLTGAGPFTVFAPTDDAFENLPAGTVQTLLQPAQKPTLQKVLTYHVVPGRMHSGDLREAIQRNGGRLTLTTAAGVPLTASLNGLTNIVVTDAKGGTAHISTYDVFQSNGVIHVVDKVLMP